MSITVPGVIWIFLMVVAFFQRNPKYMIIVTLSGMVFQATSLILIFGWAVGPQIITSLVMVIYTIVYSFRTVRFRKKLSLTAKNMSMLAAIVFLIIIVYSRWLNRREYTMESQQYFLRYCMLLIYILCYFSCWRLARRLEEEELESIIMGIITFVLVLGILQFLTTTNILPRNILWEMLIYTPDTDSAYYWGSYYPRLFSTFMEPSYCGAFLVGSFYYVITRKLNSQRIWLSICIVIGIILTFSSTAYGAFAVAGLLYLFRKNKKALKYLIPVAVVALLFILLVYFQEMMGILNRVIFEKNLTGSFSTRARWDNYAMKQFLSSPFLGVGYKNVRGSQFIYSILGQTGIFGTMAWTAMVLPLFVCGFKFRKIKPNSEIFFLIVSIISMCIAVPDADYCVFWQSMYIFALAYGKYFDRSSKKL